MNPSKNKINIDNLDNNEIENLLLLCRTSLYKQAHSQQYDSM